jgi:hypothetical protein
VLTPAQLQQRTDDRFPDNDFLLVTPKSFRDQTADLIATFVPLAEANVPVYDSKRFYSVDYLVTFNGLYYRAKEEGFLPAPTPGQETAEWKPDLKPLPPLLPYLEMTAHQGRDFGSDGQLVPSTLYRFTQRVNASTGDPLDDVLVVAMSRHKVNEADAYTIGLDLLTREEYLLPVSYELATDTTAPRAAGGGGGAVDAYTKDETNTLLATKGSALVQEQHTQQLNTLGAQAAPVMAYLADRSVAPFQTLGEALAFTAQTKVYMEFHAAVLELLVSDSGWPSFTNCTGTVVYLGEDVHLDLRGKTNANLTIQAARFYQKAGTFGGQVNVVSTATASAPPATLPFLDGDWAVPINLTGRIQASGTYASLLGTGTVYVVEPFYASYLDPGVTVVRSGGGSSSVLTLTPARTADYFLQLTDAGCMVPVTSSTAVTVTVPAHASVPFAVGTTLYVAQDGTGPVSIVAAGGVVIQTADGYRVPGRWQDVALHKRDLNTWVLKGALS